MPTAVRGRARRGRRALLLVAALVAAAVGAHRAAAQESQPVLLILDASGSMNRVDDTGTVLIDGAQAALTRLVELIPEGAAVGLRVYGHRVPNTDRVNGCLDTELVVPVGPLDPASMVDAIDSFGARGYTPIGLSLREAAKDLPDGRGTIILVSDGEDTCAPPDPCEVAEELIAQGIDIRVHTVGFFLAEDDAARSQLQCIAEATDGIFREVTAIDPLSAELGNLVRGAIPNVGRLHLPLTGSLELATAEVLPLGPPYEAHTAGYLAAEGAYEVVLAPGETRWFAVEVEEGQEVSLHGAHRSYPPGVDDDTVELFLLDEQFEDARRNSPRSGPSRIVLADFQPDGPSVAATTKTEFSPWDQLGSFDLDTIAYQGMDRSSYEEAWLAVGLEPREPPQPAGTYYLGIGWESEQTSGELVVGFGVSVTVPVPGFGTDYDDVDGGLEPSSAPLLEPEVFDAFELPPRDYPLHRALVVGEIERAETRWYRFPVERELGISVAATLVRTDSEPAGELVIEIYDPEQRPIGHAATSPQTVAVEGERAVAGASMIYEGDGEVPPGIEGEVLFAATWSGEGSERGEIRLIADVADRYPPGISIPIESEATIPPGEPADESAAPEDVEGDRAAWLPIGVGAVLALLVAGGGVIALRSRRRSAS